MRIVESFKRWFHGAPPPEDRPEPEIRYYVTDFDRINAGPFANVVEAYAETDRLANKFPGNDIHLLKTILIARRHSV